MRPLSKFKVFFVALLLSCASVLWASCLDAVLGQIAEEIRNGGSTQQDLDTLIAYTKNLDPTTDTAKGVVAAISSRAADGDGANRAAQIIHNFSGSQDSIFSSLAPFRTKPGFSDLVVGLGNPNPDTAFGSSEELRFALTQLGPDNVKAFQVSLKGTVPDIQDINLNLYEIKARNWAAEVPFLQEQDLQSFHDKAVIAISQLPPGKTLTLAFDVALPADTEVLYQTIFQDLIKNPQFIRVNGF